MKNLLAEIKFASQRFFIAGILFSLFTFFSNLIVLGQLSYSLKFNKVRVFNGLNENGSITSERFETDGGSVEITLNGNVQGLCPGGSERVRFAWNFTPIGVSQLSSNSTVGARLEISQVSASRPCVNGLSQSSSLALGGSDGSSTPFTAEEARTQNGGLFYERGGILGVGAKTININTSEYTNSDLKINTAWFHIFVATPAGQIKYVYLFDIIRGGDFTYGNIGGAWESNYSGSWKPAGIRQEGKSLWFTNEMGDVSEGRFESPSRITGTKWNVGGGLDGLNTIKWDNGTTWRRGTTTITMPDISGAWESNYSGSWKPASIKQEVKSLWFTNEMGDVSEGMFESSTRIKATKWSVGAGLDGLNTIRWDNGTTWRRATTTITMPDISGQWLFRNISGQNCSITQNGNSLGVVTEKGVSASGSFQNSSTIVVDFPFARGVKGTLTDNGNRINWSNGEWWQRGSGSMPDISGRWLFRNISGQNCSVTQNGNNIGVVTEKGIGASGNFQNSSTIVVDFPYARGLTGSIIDNGNRINWANGEWWQRGGSATVPNISGTWLFRNISDQICFITQNGNSVGVVTEKGAEANGSFQNSSAITVDFPFAQGVTGTIVNNGSRINWSNGEWWQRK